MSFFDKVSLINDYENLKFFILCSLFCSMNFNGPVGTFPRAIIIEPVFEPEASALQGQRSSTELRARVSFRNFGLLYRTIFDIYAYIKAYSFEIFL